MPQPGAPRTPSGPFLLRGRRGEMQVGTATEVPAALASFFPGEPGVEILDARTGQPVPDGQGQALRGASAAVTAVSRSITIPPPRPRGSSTAEPPVGQRPRSAARPPERRAAHSSGLPVPVLLGGGAVVVLLVVIAVLLMNGPQRAAARPAAGDDGTAVADPARTTGATDPAAVRGAEPVQSARGGMVVVSIGGVAVAPGGAAIIGREVLDVAQPGATPDEVVYTLSAPPAHGWLRRDLAALNARASFTQTDVAENRISYEHGDLGEARDAFQVTVAGPHGGALPALTCALTVGGAGLARGLVAWWPFAEGAGATTADASGNGNAGALRRAAWIAGPIGGALEFDGHGSVACGNAAALRPAEAITVTAWVRTRQDRGGVSILRHDGHFTALQLLGGGRAQVACWIDGSLREFPFPWKDVADSGAWHHYAASYGASSGVKVYLDGRLHASNPQLHGALSTATGTGVFLGAAETGGEPFTGALDEVRIYDRLLEAGEVRLLALQAAPAIANLSGATAAFTRGGAPVALDAAQAAWVSDGDDLCFAGGRLLVELAERAGGDALALAAAGPIGVAGGVVSHRGRRIGAIAGARDGTPGHDLEIAFDSRDATPAALGDLLRALTYGNTDAAPAPGARTIRVTLSDGALVSAPATVTVTIAP